MAGGTILGVVITLFVLANFAYIAARLIKDIRDRDTIFITVGFFALIASLGMILLVIFGWWISDTNLALGA